MFDRIDQWQPDQDAAVAARTVGALALAALAVIHVVDLPGTLGPDRLVGIGYLGIIAAAILIGGVLIARPHWLAWAAAAAVAVSAMGGYILTRALPGHAAAAAKPAGQCAPAHPSARPAAPGSPLPAAAAADPDVPRSSRPSSSRWLPERLVAGCRRRCALACPAA
jgi:hypothetical protein